MLRFATALLLATAAAPAPGPVPVPDQLLVHAVRFYHAGSGLTQVRAFIQVPLEALAPADASSPVQYRMTVRLRDEAGTILSEGAWPDQRVPAELMGEGVTTVNSVEFVVKPGRYRLEVNVRDSVAGTSLDAATDLHGFANTPAASDLVLAPAMRPLGSDSSPHATEWRSGSLLVTSAARLVLTPLRARAFYMFEAYAEEADSGTMIVHIRDAAGTPVVTSKPVPVRVAAGGGVLRGQLDLEGLPEGDYRFAVMVNLGGRLIEREETFTMTGVAATLARRAAELAMLAGSDSGYFGQMDEARLDAAWEPLSYLAGSSTLRPYRNATLAAKRQFLVGFWQSRDRDSVPGRNLLREEFYGKIAYADSMFRERGNRTQSGWKTDRGRVYARHGGPDETLDRVRDGQAPSYQVWRFTRGKPRYYVFADRSGLGAYKLILTNDLQEPGAADWRDILGPVAVRDIGLFLGLDFFERN